MGTTPKIRLRMLLLCKEFDAETWQFMPGTSNVLPVMVAYLGTKIHDCLTCTNGKRYRFSDDPWDIAVESVKRFGEIYT